ncbi:hypothetical protein Gogos_016793 [Gossypium gossypioides]|uniref:DUF4283 domain-containing protein n=1 Tax=Gossypium gossypioides TaxID=34282 RepID=A0A7J9B8Q9_GOSGO|nr:hypothetical protein [Gossypium gossypioides]
MVVTTMDIAANASKESKLLWKDKLTGKGIVGSRKSVNSNRLEDDDDDFKLFKGDVTRSVVNGIPSIEFFDRVYQLLIKDMDTTMVLTLLRLNIEYVALQSRTYNLWRPSMPFQLMEIENGYFLAKFQNKEDFDKVLSQGLWVIYGQYLMVQPWTIDFRSSQPYLSIVMAWICLSGLLGYMYKRKIVEEIDLI